MAKKTTPAQTEPKVVQVRYDLHDLPTAQHKAGLAGLLLQVQSMQARRLPPMSIPKLNLVGPTVVEAEFSEPSVRGLFDDLYDAEWVEVESPSRWPGAEAVRERDGTDPKTGKPRKLYVYEVVQPKGHFLRQFTDGKEAWHKLWRDMLWAIPRGKPTTRGPFNSRADDQTCAEGPATWKELLAMEKAKGRGEIRICEVAGAILLGAQAVNAEAVPFCDRVDHALLLHFWQLVVRVFVPERVSADGSREFAGYVLAIPEVGDLPRFTRRFTRAMSQLDAKAPRFRPQASIISLPAQGALEFMDGLVRFAAEVSSLEVDDVARALDGVEFFHMVKAGNNIKSMATGRIAVSAELLRGYQGIKSSCRNPLFISARIVALLRGAPWHTEFDAMFAERDWPLFVRSERTPRGMPSFAWDARSRFESQIQQQQKRESQPMSDAPSEAPLRRPNDQPKRLETLVYRLVRNYVRIKTEQKSGATYASFKDKKVKDAKGRERVEYPKAYSDAQEKVCSDLFLGFRSRRDEDFVSYFTGTIGSVAQGPNLSDENDFGLIARALLDSDERRDVKTLAMLAVSAASYASAGPQDDQDKTEAKETAQ